MSVNLVIPLPFLFFCGPVLKSILSNFKHEKYVQMTKAVVTRKKVSYIYVLSDLHAPNTIRCLLNRRKKVLDKRNQYHHCHLRNLQLIRTQDLHHSAHLCSSQQDFFAALCADYHLHLLQLFSSSQHNFFVALHADCDFQLLQHLCY